MPVLETKLFVPPPRSQAVPRPRLIGRLDAGIRAGRKLTLISAPAGFGKTTLCSEWIGLVRRREPQVRVAWLALEEGDNDPIRFLTYLSAALHRANPDIGADDHGVPSSVEATLTTLINEISRSVHSVILFLDDFHLIEDPAVRDAVAFLLDHLPSTMHVAIASRSDPLLPIGRLRAGGHLTELRAADLRFTTDEAAAFLNQVMGLTLTRDDVAALETRTEGWIAGLQLAALSMRDTDDVPAFIDAFTGSNRFVIDYLVEQVLERAPLRVREFLGETAVLDRLSGPLCDAVTGRQDGRDMLESLERANLFIVPLDDQRRWYRYHHLFADVLRARLRAQRPEHVSALHTRASGWFERNGSLDEAVKHAFEASDFERAARVIEATIPGIRKSRQDATLLGWLAMIPDATKERRPVLLVFSAWSALVAGDLSSVNRQLTDAERLLAASAEGETSAHESEPGEELERLPVTIALYRASVALATDDLTGMAGHAQRALDVAAPEDYLGRGAAAGLLGISAWANGALEAGVAAFSLSRSNLRRAGNVTDALSTSMVIADMLLPLGRLREARLLYEEALHEALKHGNGGQPEADLHAGLSDVLREFNELAAAKEHLEVSAGMGENTLSHEHRYRWFVAMAGVREANGDLDAALESVSEAEQHYRRGFFPEARPIAGMRARLRVLQNRLPDAQAWLHEQGVSAESELTYLDEFGHITLARMLIARHRQDQMSRPLDEAERLLIRLLAAAESGGRMGSVNEILVLQTLVLQAQGHPSRALVLMERALVQAEPEGYVRLFVDEGAPMLALLRAAAGAGIRPDYVRRLSQFLRRTEGSGPVSQTTEALSDRELHVLRLLATPLSGPEIARELHVSLNTMRTHTKHIFLKLEVSGRPAAVRRAESLGLI